MHYNQMSYTVLLLLVAQTEFLMVAHVQDAQDFLPYPNIFPPAHYWCGNICYQPSTLQITGAMYPMST